MLASLRTYRLMAALLAVLLVAGGSLPLVQHACAMATRHQAMHGDDPCPGHERRQAPAPHRTSGHAATHTLMHGLPPQADAPCPHAAASSAPAARHQATPGDCCSIQAAQGTTTNGVLQAKRPLKPLAAAALVEGRDGPAQPDDPRSSTLFFDTGPPPAASVPLHLLHAVFLS